MGRKMKLRIMTKTYAVNLTIEFPTKLILRPKVFTGTTRQRGS